MNIRYYLSELVTIPAQTMMMVLSASIILYCLYMPVHDFNPVGRESYIQQITPKIIKTWGKEPVRVKTGLVLHEFLQFDVVKNEFLVNAVISFEFDPHQVQLEELDKFSFTKGDIVKKSEPLIKKISPTRTFVEYLVRIKFSTLSDYSMFPLDDHRIFLNFTNTTVEAHEVIYEVHDEDFTVPEYLFLAGWEIVSRKVVSGYTQYSSQKENVTHYPKIVFSFGIQKNDVRQLLLIMIPLLILFYFCVFSLSIKSFDTNVQEMFPLLTAFVAYVIVLHSLSPNVGYFMLMDYIVLFFMLAMFFICLVNFLCIMPENKLSKYTLAQIRGGTALMVHIALTAVMFYLTRFYQG